MQILLYCWNLENKNKEQDAQKFNKKCPDNCWKTPQNLMPQRQRAKKVVSDSPGLVDFGFGLVNSVLNLPDGQVNFLEKFKLQTDRDQSC